MAERDEAILKSVLKATPECLSNVALEQFQNLQPGDDLRRRMARHLKECPRCRTELALFQDFTSGAVRVEETKAVEWIAARLKNKQKKSWWQALQEHLAWRPVYAFAFALLLVVVVGDLYWQRGAPKLNTAVETGTVRSGGMEALAPAGEVAGRTMAFKWAPAKDAAQYRVSVMEVDGREVWDATSDAAKTEFVPEKPLPLREGTWYLWKVVALDREGRAVAESGRVRFHAGAPSQKLKGN